MKNFQSLFKNVNLKNQKVKTIKLKLLFSIPILTFIVYFLDFYILGNFYSQQFWCVEVYREFNILNLNNLRLPIHCDEGPYRFASSSLENFFDKTNPYQGRPLFVLLIAIFRNFFNLISFYLISDYLIFRISMIFLQMIILFFIFRTFVSITDLKFKAKNDYLILFLLISTPSIRWNLFFSSVENITFLLFLMTLNYVHSKNEFIIKNNKIFIFFGILSLAHMSAIIYGLIIELFRIIKYKKIEFKIFTIRLLHLFVYQFIYRIIVLLSDFTFYDWHKEIYNQFYWILDIFQGKESIADCQTFDTFWRCNFEVSQSFIGYFLILLIYVFILFIAMKYLDYDLPRLIVYSFYINLLIFIFWSLQGLYEPFRFVNYSIGYFLFFASYVYVLKFEKNTFLILSILFYQYSILYLEPYNTALNLPQINIFTLISFILFSIFIVNLLIKNNKKQFSKYN